MKELTYRTEDIDIENIKNYYVELSGDREIIEQLKSKMPVILVGSRGIGKTFLMKMAELELIEDYQNQKVLPVFVTFRKAPLINLNEHNNFHYWMMARICTEVIRSLRKTGELRGHSKSMSKLTGDDSINLDKTKIEEIAIQYEESYKKKKTEIDNLKIPSIDDFVNSIEDICIENNIKRIILFIDEAAHVLYPEQQRQFFTLFRDLRTQYISCNASVYPGVTSFGDTFQPTHDATLLKINRNVEDKQYVHQMKEVILNQVNDSSLQTSLSQYGENFELLAYAASGNPRTLIKTINFAQKLDSNSVNNVFREFYKTDIWAEHTNLAGLYQNYKELIDWGRDFTEKEVLREISLKNSNYISNSKPTSAYFWIDRNSPQVIKEALRLLEYTGIIYEDSKGIRASGDGIGTRYMINIGCLLSLEKTPTSTGLEIVRNFTKKRMTEFSGNSPHFKELTEKYSNFSEMEGSSSLLNQLDKSIDNLELTTWQLTKIKELGINTIGELLNTQESDLKKIPYVADIRARNIKNTVYAAIFEYLM